MPALSEACERNKEPILAVLRGVLAEVRSVLEVGSGTGQHAVHFAAHLPRLRWQASEVPALLPPLAAYLGAADLPNLPAPLALDLHHEPWPEVAAEALFSANTLHIMDWAGVEALFRLAGATLGSAGVLALYGPFRYDGRHTSRSNAEFDAFLRARDPASGVRDVRELEPLGQAQGFSLRADHDMPANNRTLIFARASA